jgi:deoxycytidine triphosphate deaminase
MVQPGYTGCLTLELVNEGETPIRLYPGLRIAQLAIHALDQVTKHPYEGPGVKYLAPIGPEESRVGWERDEMEHVKQVGMSLRREPEPG